MKTQKFKTAAGLSLAADVGGDPKEIPVILMHGGGQTRQSWKRCFQELVGKGYFVVSLDGRGHGESDWDPEGNYNLDAFAEDLLEILAQLPAKPILVGASMGGVTALAAIEQAQTEIASGLVLVDVTPKINEDGAQRIGAFMRANLNGFASLEEVADAVTAYNPHRPRPKDLSGLRNNLREVNGRFYWHWDPEFLGARRLEPHSYQKQLEIAARNITIPTLLIRGNKSDIVGDEEIEHFRALMPRAEFVDIKDAGHMVAGDKNDAFNAAIINFIQKLHFL